MKGIYLASVSFALLAILSSPMVASADAPNAGTKYGLSYAQLRTPGLPPPPPPFCNQSADKDLNNWVEMRHVSLPIEGEAATHIRLVTAGRRIILKLPEQWEHESGRLWVSVYAKSFGTEQFNLVCRRFPLIHSAKGAYFEAGRPAQSEWSIWRIEFTIAAAEGDRRTDDIAIFRDPFDPNRAATSMVPEVWNNASGYLCEEVEEPIGERARTSRGFAGKTRLDVDIGQTDPPLSARSHVELQRLVLRAVTIWVQACAACAPAHLAVAAVDGKLFVRQGLQRWYSDVFLALRERNIAPNIKQLDRDLKTRLQPVAWLILGSGSPPRAKDLTEYEEAKTNFAALCSVQLPRNAPPTLRSVRQAVCGPANSEERANVLIRFRDSQTACGFGPNIIACRADAELTEYNVRDFQFTIDASRTDLEPIGAGSVQLDFLHVLLHEMGHWIGLPHLNVGQSIMNSSLMQSRCIDSHTVAALADANKTQIDDERHAGPQAFTYR